MATGSQPQKDVGKYIFFDFENGWQQLVRDDFELDLSQIENELVVTPLMSHPSSRLAAQVFSQNYAPHTLVSPSHPQFPGELQGGNS
jgi:hypothetical protein